MIQMTEAEHGRLTRDAARWNRLIDYKGRDGWLVLSYCADDTAILVGDFANAAMDEEIANDIMGQGLDVLRASLDAGG